MSMTPEEAKCLICPVLPRLKTHVNSLNLEVESQQKCIGPACMWWIDDGEDDDDGSCAIYLLAEYADLLEKAAGSS